jgi:hypothetical protein
MFSIPQRARTVLRFDLARELEAKTRCVVVDLSGAPETLGYLAR